MGDFIGVIIEESLKDPKLPEGVKILSTKVENVTTSHKTPWLKKWTLYTVLISENKAEEAAEVISRFLETEHTSWYADFKNEKFHYVIFPNKVFRVTSGHKEDYQKAKDYGLSLGIPDYQLDFEEMK